MFDRRIAAAAFAIAMVASPGSAEADDPIYPVFECWEQVSPTDVRLHFGATSLLTTFAIPALNNFDIDGNAVAAPPGFAPGYSPRVFAVTVSTTSGVVTWVLGQMDFVMSVDTAALEPDKRCSSEAGVAGPTGPTGPTGVTGATGPTGPAGAGFGDCELATASIPEGKEFGTELLIACAPDETVVQGGGICGKGNLRGSYQVDATTWKVVCRSPKGIQGSALCCPTN